MTTTAADDTDATAEVFVLSRPHGTVRAIGASAAFTDAHAAADALRAATVDAITGAIGFDRSGRSALVAPDALEHTSTPVAGSPAQPHTVTARSFSPEQVEHRDRVGHAIKAIADGGLDKVVLARAVDLTVEPAVEIPALIDALAHGNVEHNAFAVNVGAVWQDASWLLGSSPEVLLRKEGRVVTCQPYAGSLPRHPDPATDRAAAETLRTSSKDLAEHAFVVDYLRERLAPLCDELDARATPEIRATGEIWHLATPIRGVLHDDSVTALDLALLLSPTPAVCGTPSDAAAQFITDTEGDRGLYAGTVGWCNTAGDGEWMVTIRCLHLGADRHTMRTWAGGGIVAQSDPQAELDETTAKLGTVLNALGIAH